MKNISLDDIKNFRIEYRKDKNNKIIENAITNNGVNEVALNREILNESKRLMTMHRWDLARMYLSFVGWVILGISFSTGIILALVLIIGLKLSIINSFPISNWGWNIKLLFSFISL